jgi:5'-nucleotidase
MTFIGRIRVGLMSLTHTSASKLSILLTNDDGYQAAGLRALWRELDEEFDTTVVAPSGQRSWIGKAISNREPLTVSQETVDGKQIFVVHDGTPADCTNIGIYHLLPQKPALVISGINNGANFTNSLILASGTVGGALEAALDGVLGIAASLDIDEEMEIVLRGAYRPEHLDLFAPAARTVRHFVRSWLARMDAAHVKLVNLLLPLHIPENPEFIQSEPLPYIYGSVFEKRGDSYYNRGRGFLEDGIEIHPESDVARVRQGQVAFTCYSGKLERIRL